MPHKAWSGNITFASRYLLFGVCNMMRGIYATCLCLLGAIPAFSAERVIVMVCPRNDMAHCTPETARIIFEVRLESEGSGNCLLASQAKAAQVRDMYDSQTEAVKIRCPR